jgi:predicted anti-sigma-YlaC factor YlaD
MPSCLEASRLLSRALDEPLGLLDQALLRVHLSMCGRCAEVQRQLGTLGELTRSAIEADDADDPPAGPPAPTRPASPDAS